MAVGQLRALWGGLFVLGPCSKATNPNPRSSPHRCKSQGNTAVAHKTCLSKLVRFGIAHTPCTDPYFLADGVQTNSVLKAHVMSLDLWLTFVAASTALLIMPGPTLLLVLSYALTQGRRVAIASALGVATGDFIAMTLSVIGLGALFLASATAFTILKWVGAIYLIYLGIRMLRAPSGQSALMDKPKDAPAGKVFRDLTAVTALNPKSNTFFIAFVPQFISADTPFAPQASILVATFVIIAAVNALIFALSANALRHRITRPSVQTWLSRGGGMTLIGMGFLTMTLRRAS